MEKNELEIELTPREIEVLNLMAKGMKNLEIGAELFISLSTVKTHVRSIYKKMKVRNRIEATIKLNKK